MTVNAITDTKKGRTGIAPTYLHTTQNYTKLLHQIIRIQLSSAQRINHTHVAILYATIY